MFFCVNKFNFIQTQKGSAIRKKTDPSFFKSHQNVHKGQTHGTADPKRVQLKEKMK